MRILGMGILEWLVILAVICVAFIVMTSPKRRNCSDESAVSAGKATELSVSELKGYKELLDSGAITQEECDEKKKLLGLWSHTVLNRGGSK